MLRLLTVLLLLFQFVKISLLTYNDCECTVNIAGHIYDFVVLFKSNMLLYCDQFHTSKILGMKPSLSLHFHLYIIHNNCMLYNGLLNLNYCFHFRESALHWSTALCLWYLLLLCCLLGRYRCICLWTLYDKCILYIWLKVSSQDLTKSDIYICSAAFVLLPVEHRSLLISRHRTLFWANFSLCLQE